MIGYVEWVLGDLRGKSLMHVVTEQDADTGALFGRNSYNTEFGGRVGLHSLPQSEKFYEKTCAMTRGEIDLQYEKLCWFELTANNVKKFLGGKP